MKEVTKLEPQSLGCLAAAAAVLFVVAVWIVLSYRRAHRLDAEYGFSIVSRGFRTGEIQAFHEDILAFSIPIDYDHVPPLVNFTAALIDIPDADAEMWRERLSEYLKRRWKRYVIV